MTISIALFGVFYLLLSIFFSSKGAKFGRLVRVSAIAMVLGGAIYYYVAHQKFIEPLIAEGRLLGSVEGVGQSAGWCLKSAQLKFPELLINEAEPKIRGYAAGCLAVANGVEAMCAALPTSFEAAQRGDFLGKRCGVYGVCEEILDVALSHCQPNSLRNALIAQAGLAWPGCAHRRLLRPAD